MNGFLPSRSGRFRSGALQRLDAHLTVSIEQLSAPTKTQESEPPMRGMRRLANLTQTASAAMDAKADAVADRIVTGQARAEEAIAKFAVFAEGVEATAAEIEAALGQITNE